MDDKGSPSGPGAIAKALELLNAQKDEDASALLSQLSSPSRLGRELQAFLQKPKACVSCWVGRCTSRYIYTDYVNALFLSKNSYFVTAWKKAGMDVLLFAMQHNNRSRDFKLNIVEMYAHEVMAGYSQSHPPSFVGWLDPWGLWLSVKCGGWHVGQAECEVRGRESGFRESWSREEDIAPASDDQPQESKDCCQWRGLR